MSWFYRNAIRPILFTQEAESIHNRTMALLNRAGRSELLCDAMHSFLGAPPLPVELFGLRFPNPIGLAAGMDKNAVALPAWAAMGFGFAELGAATWHAQPGNPEPRVFRAIPEEAIVNRMGFNNLGAEVIAERLADWKKLGRWPKHPVGMNLGKSKITPLDKAAEDYANSFRVLRPHLDFFVVNVSSPNTPNLRQLQDKSALDEIFAALQEVQSPPPGAPVPKSRPVRKKPILVKVAPDLTFEALDEILELVGPREIAGIVATNTTISRPASNIPVVQKVYAETGGLSGHPLRARSTEVIRHLYRQTGGKLPIIGVGGIFTAADAWEKIAAGASLVQVYTGLVYEGPGICRRIVSGLLECLETRALPGIASAVGRE
ncbi:MAG TPA: quinone-dependent dihydroorotate dehydrogenase [Candidatus Polarisedimenticolia bacterium]|nr:quinone-dependent dihydroorotate dehydrogenase [Candidatus Polarisedimenticolia bacterium]